MEGLITAVIAAASRCPRTTAVKYATIRVRVAARIEAPHARFEVSGEPVDEVALGGTMWSYGLGPQQRARLSNTF
ncbi:MAG: hypothetical protein ACRDHS_10705 [Actinomycetota bacterium]